MHDLPRQKLCELIASHGRSLCDDPRRCEGLLRDHCGAHKREISVLVSALKERVVADLLGSQSAVPPEVMFARLTQRLQDDLGLADDAACWAVESWALALGVTSVAKSAKGRRALPNDTRHEPPPKYVRDGQESLSPAVRSRAWWLFVVAVVLTITLAVYYANSGKSGQSAPPVRPSTEQSCAPQRPPGTVPPAPRLGSWLPPCP